MPTLFDPCDLASFSIPWGHHRGRCLIDLTSKELSHLNYRAMERGDDETAVAARYELRARRGL